MSARERVRVGLHPGIRIAISPFLRWSGQGHCLDCQIV